MTLGKVIDQLIESKKRSGIAGNSYEYSEFLNLKRYLLEIKMMLGCFAISESSLEGCKAEYFSNYSPYAPSIQTRKSVWNQLMQYIKTHYQK
ncbi:MAG: hypothetical protein N2645_15180 [Clostridia bacterium]|nr:hypothetical protein [Clostridia bacterium]